MGLRVAEADEDRARASRRQQILARPVKDHEWFSAFLASNLHVSPAKLCANSRAKGLGNGFVKHANWLSSSVNTYRDPSICCSLSSGLASPLPRRKSQPLSLGLRYCGRCSTRQGAAPAAPLKDFHNSIHGRR